MKPAPVLILLAFTAVPALAATVESADLTLAQPAAQGEYIIDGADWRCSGTVCHSDFVDDMPALRSCKRVVAVTGAVAAFTWRGKVLSPAEISVCNTRAAGASVQ